MSFPPQLPAKVYEFADRIRSVLGGFFHRAAHKAAELLTRVRRVLDGLLLRMPLGKRRLIIIVSMGGLAIILLIIGIAYSAQKKPIEQIPAAIRQGNIPPEELFLLNEPDFVPGVLLEREQRSIWTAEDAQPLWQDPLINGEEPWRDRIEKTIDEIMESVP